MRTHFSWFGTVVLLAAVVFTLPVRPQVATISFCDVPTVLPRNTPLGSYSPAVCFAYKDLEAEVYTAKVYLLEEDPPPNYFCGSGQWCGDASNPRAVFSINNSSGINSSGAMTIVQNMSVYSYTNFLWKIDLYNQGGVTVASVTQSASSTLNRAPILGFIGDKVSPVCQPLEFFVSASDPEDDNFILTSPNLPPGSSIDLITGRFYWACPVRGRYTIIFKAIQTGMYPLSDAEIVTMVVGPLYLPLVMK